MKKRLLLLAFSLFALIYTSRAQAFASINLPTNLAYDGSEQTLQVTVQGISWTYPQMKTFVGTLGQISGVTYFNPVVTEGQSEGYFELRFKAGSKADFQHLLRQVFCTLDIQRVQLNQIPFESCQQILVP